MEILDRMADHGYDQVVFCSEEAAGLKAIIAIHDTTLDPGCGGLRMRCRTPPRKKPWRMPFGWPRP